jgi:ATP-dependent RNA helicase RhlE
MTTFNDFGLHADINRALAAKDYTTPTPIQAQSIPPLLEGRDLLGIAQTGTGKTAGVHAPLDRAPRRYRTSGRSRAVAACSCSRRPANWPARSRRAPATIARAPSSASQPCSAACSIHKNKTDLARGVDILVATPGRLVDLIEQRYALLLGIEILVLDEADQMMDMGFIHSLKRIVRELPSKRQTCSSRRPCPSRSATSRPSSSRIRSSVKVTPVATTAERVEQYVTFVNQAEKQSLLTIALRDESIDRALIFTRTKHGADRVVKLLAARGVASNAIHGNKSQPQRERALGEFKSGKVKMLVATDIAARGIDVSGVSHVFNFELPNVPEQYVHRIGRTARAGATGIAISYCADDERPYLRDIEFSNGMISTSTACSRRSSRRSSFRASTKLPASSSRSRPLLRALR